MAKSTHHSSTIDMPWRFYIYYYGIDSAISVAPATGEKIRGHLVYNGDRQDG